MVNRIGKAKDDMSKDEFIFWLSAVKKKSFGEVLAEIADFYSKAHEVEKRMIESVLLTDLVDSLVEAESNDER